MTSEQKNSKSEVKRKSRSKKSKNVIDLNLYRRRQNISAPKGQSSSESSESAPIVPFVARPKRQRSKFGTKIAYARLQSPEIYEMYIEQDGCYSLWRLPADGEQGAMYPSEFIIDPETNDADWGISFGTSFYMMSQHRAKEKIVYHTFHELMTDLLKRFPELYHHVFTATVRNQFQPDRKRRHWLY